MQFPCFAWLPFLKLDFTSKDVVHRISPNGSETCSADTLDQRPMQLAP